MANRLHCHIRSNAVAYVALFIALVGVPVTWAATRNSIGSAQIKPSAVKTSDIADGAVNSAKVADGSIRGKDLAGSPPSGMGTNTVVVARYFHSDPLPERFGNGIEVHCHAGEQLVGGGGEIDLENGYQLHSYPITSSGQPARNTAFADGWRFSRYPNFPVGANAYALCATWGQPAAGPTGPQGATGPQGPPGTVSDQECPANEFVRGFSGGQIVCAPASP